MTDLEPRPTETGARSNRTILHTRLTAAVLAGAFGLAATVTFIDGVGGPGGDLLSLAYGGAAAVAVGWASIRQERRP